MAGRVMMHIASGAMASDPKSHNGPASCHSCLVQCKKAELA